MPDLAPDAERPHPILTAQITNGRLSLARARNGGTHVFWQAPNDDAMTGAIATVMDAMRGWRSILAGRTVLRCCAGYPIREDKFRPGHWFVCTLAEGDYELSPDGRSLFWCDPTNRPADPCAPQLEPAVMAAVLGTEAQQRRAAAEAPLRTALARTGMRKATDAGAAPNLPPPAPR
jgi:hypothetical protein